MLEYPNNYRRATLTGAGLAQRRRRMSPAERAVLAADIVDGRVVLQGLTVKSIAALVGVNVGYVDHALKLTPAQRQQVRDGDRPLIWPRPHHGGCWGETGAPVDWEAVGPRRYGLRCVSASQKNLGEQQP
jgi:hypothetical protein